ncbi:MAG TPA: hypothetical protein EYN66_11425 [Myxococcales bacterium]|nr:hypothetical protein [Myxococcales bacterium]
MQIFNKHLLLTVLALVAFTGCGDSTPDANTDLGNTYQDPGPALETVSDSNTEVEQPDSYVETGPGLGIDYSQSESGAVPRYEPDGAHWLAVGWPNNRRLLNNGAPDLTGFAQPGLALLSSYLLYGMEVLDGFSTVGSSYFEFSAALLHSELPEPQDSTHPLSIVQLVNVSPDSAYYGKQVPLRFRFEAEGDPYYSPNTLAARPVFGLPLESAQDYCLLVTRGVKDTQGRYLSQAPEFVKALPQHATLAPLRHWLKDSPLHSVDIAVASCFTTQDPTREMREIGVFLDQQPSPEVSSIAEPAVYGEFYGSYSSPNFQAGDKPYYSEGDIRFDADGQPIVQEQDLMRFMLLIPRNSSMPASGWPIVLYAHGTGGDYESCRGTANTLNAVGLAVLCVDQPLHGVRGPDPKKTLSDTELVTATCIVTVRAMEPFSSREDRIIPLAAPSYATVRINPNKYLKRSNRSLNSKWPLMKIGVGFKTISRVEV